MASLKSHQGKPCEIARQFTVEVSSETIDEEATLDSIGRELEGPRSLFGNRQMWQALPMKYHTTTT